MEITKVTKKEWEMTLTDEQAAYLESLRPHTPNPSFYELLEIYPDAIPAARRGIKARMKELKEKADSLSSLRNTVMNDINRMHFKEQPIYIAWLDEMIDRYHDEYARELKQLKWQLSYLDRLESPDDVHPPETDDITPDRIARAKTYPIGELVTIKRGHYCLCPFHDDHHPSMFVYKDNHAYCYSCSKRADAIDMCMKVRGMTFRDAVRTLAP